MNSEPHKFDDDAEHLVAELLTEFQTTGTCRRERLSRLVQLAVADDMRVAQLASTAFFASLVETLADSFEPAAVSLYNQAFAHLIHACRNTERGRPLDEKLSEFGLLTEADVLGRADRVRTSSLDPGRSWVTDVSGGPSGSRSCSGAIRVVVLSRVTLGADVAITSVIIERLKTAFPNAEIVLVGGRKPSELFGGDPRLSFKHVGYPRGATAIDRLLAWLALVECIRELMEGAGHVLIVDPDSRLSQLGLLPLAATSASLKKRATCSYLFFPSREYRHESSSSLGALASTWADEALGFSQPAAPAVSLSRADVEAARSVVARVRRDRRPVITVNFGVGGNARKRVSDDFERKIVASLLSDGATVILDKGAGEVEQRRAVVVIEFAKGASNDRMRLIQLDEKSLSGAPDADRIEAELVVWSGRIGMLAGLIGRSDLYVGYDSAGQHIAAALGVPCVDVFAGFSSRRMLERWRPTGEAETRIVAVQEPITEEMVLGETLRHARELMSVRAPIEPQGGGISPLDTGV